MSTSVTSVVSHFPDAENGFTTTLASTISSGTATVPLNSVAGYTNGEPAVFVVDPSDITKKQTFTGIIDTSGVQVTSVVWTAGTNQTHAGGATVVDYATATHIAMISKGIKVQHSQAGAHTAITATSLAATGDISSSAGKITTTAVGKLEDRGIALDTYRAGMVFNYVVSGGVWTADAAGSTRNASMTAITVMINGQLLNSTNSAGLAAVTARTFTASKDTYIDILNTAGAGTIVYTEATNDAASPALAANSIRIGIVVTAAGSIASAAKINQGQITATSPTISSNILLGGLDSLGNSIYQTSPSYRKINYQGPVQADQNVTATSFTDITNVTFTYKSGAVAETIYLWLGVMFGLNVASSAYVTLSIDGTDQSPAIFWSSATVHRGNQLFTYRVAASTTIIIKLRGKTSANTETVYQNDVLNVPTLRGQATT